MILCWLLRLVGGVCALAILALFMPHWLMVEMHARLGLGEFPQAPIAEYLARSVSALCAFYGGLLIWLASDVRRYGPVIAYQATAIMICALSGLYLGLSAGMPLWFVGGDALACVAFGLPTLWLVAKI
ncbi:MAG: hypothetical protein SFX18_18430 [Pirellulales bacterium]|nr:hypothetical protein [Pirellulales bacterium]